MTRPGRCVCGRGAVSPVRAPRPVLSRRSTTHPGLPVGARIGAGFASRNQAGHAEVLRPTCRVPWAGPQCSGVAWARRWGREPLPPSVSLGLLSQILGVRGGRQQWSPGPLFPSQASGQDAGGRGGKTRWQGARKGAWRGGGSTIGRPNQASRQTDEGNNIITPRTPWGRYSKYHIK